MFRDVGGNFWCHGDEKSIEFKSHRNNHSCEHSTKLVRSFQTLVLDDADLLLSDELYEETIEIHRMLFEKQTVLISEMYSDHTSELASMIIADPCVNVSNSLLTLIEFCCRSQKSFQDCWLNGAEVSEKFSMRPLSQNSSKVDLSFQICSDLEEIAENIGQYVMHCVDDESKLEALESIFNSAPVRCRAVIFCEAESMVSTIAETLEVRSRPPSEFMRTCRPT